MYLDDLLVITKGSFEDHLLKLDEVLVESIKAGLKLNLKTSFLVCVKTYYLGYRITREGLMAQQKVIFTLKPFTTLKLNKCLLWIVQY